MRSAEPELHNPERRQCGAVPAGGPGHAPPTTPHPTQHTATLQVRLAINVDHAPAPPTTGTGTPQPTQLHWAPKV
jgi:hypothetical protein